MDFGFVLLILGLVDLSHQRFLTLADLQDIMDSFGDEIVSHENLPSASETNEHLVNDIPHPVKINNWAPYLKVGQISAVSVNPEDQPVIFQRGPHEWNSNTFDLDWKLKDMKPIEEDTIMVLDPDSGEIVKSFGSNMFYVPHGLTVDGEGNIYVTDVGLHQVMRLRPNQSEPELIIGEAFVPGNDNKHFCAPTSVAVADNSDFFFVSDGYCNSRILKYNKHGELISIINGNWNIPHSLALFENSDVICVANREEGEIDCLRAGLYGSPLFAGKDATGTKVTRYDNLGKVYAIAEKGTALLAICTNPVAGMTIDTASNDASIVDKWATNDNIVRPHDVAISPRGDAVYVAEVAGKDKSFKLHKFEVLIKSDDIN